MSKDPWTDRILHPAKYGKHRAGNPDDQVALLQINGSPKAAVMPEKPRLAVINRAMKDLGGAMTPADLRTAYRALHKALRRDMEKERT